MNARERVEMVLRQERPDKVPFTIYSTKPPPEPAFTQLKARGLCVVERLGVYSVRTPNCRVETTPFEEDGRQLIRTDIRTPEGDLYTIREPAGFTTWTHKYLFADENDYRALAFYLGDAVIEPSYDRAHELLGNPEDNTILRTTFGLEPLQHLISGGVFGTMHFCTQWMDNRDEILKLYRIMVEKRRLTYPIVAQSPVGHANYGGNVVPEIIGLDTFRECYVPNYQEAAREMHRHGKLIGVHFDANCRLFSREIAALDLDYIEAFTPAPDTDMTLREARDAWPGKVLWINYPSSVHVQSEERVEQVTVELLETVDPAAGVIVGITEDLPAGREAGNYRAIMDGIDRYEATRGTPRPE